MEERKIIKPILRLDENGKKMPEDRLYLILFSYTDDTTSWNIVMGRKEAYEKIKFEIVQTQLVDVEESYILVEDHKFGTEVSLYEFMKHMENFFQDTNFDIEDYSFDSSEEIYNNELQESDDMNESINTTIDSFTDDSEEI